MNREKSLIKNTIMYFLGSLGKGLSPIIIVFFASYYISPSSMGIYDLVISTIALLQPIVIFQINDAIYRWLLDSKYSALEVIICGSKIAFINLLIVNISFIPISFYLPINNKLVILLLLNINCIYPIVQQITRGLKNHKIFAESGIINALFVIIFSFFAIGLFKMDILGLYISQIISTIISILYMYVKQKNIITYSEKLKIDSKLTKNMIFYSIMLVPNSVNQWVMKALDKFFILLYMGTAANGIYSVAHRFPEILLMANNMFYSAWVEQSIIEYKSNDRDEYFSKIYNYYVNIIFSIILLLIPITKHIIEFLVGSEYIVSWKYVPFLYLGVAFSAFSSFYGTGYLSTKKTKGILKTSVAGSAVNIIINIVFMPIFGLQIASIAFFFAYFSMWLYRVIETRKFFNIEINYIKFLILFLISLVYSIVIIFSNVYIDIVLIVLALIIAIIINKGLIMIILKRKSKN